MIPLNWLLRVDRRVYRELTISSARFEMGNPLVLEHAELASSHQFGPAPFA